MLPKLSLNIFRISLILCFLFAISVQSEYVKGNLRQSSEQRRQYIPTAGTRYKERVSNRSQYASILTNPSENEVAERPSFARQYSANRHRKFLEQYSMNVEASEKNLSPRQEYLKEWSKLPQSSQTELTSKREQLITLYHDTGSPYVQFNVRDFVQYALNGPRPYWLWICFTVLDSSMHCPNCSTYHSYWSHVTPPLQKASIANPSDPLPLVMAVLTPSTAREVWMALQLNRAPVSVLLPPEFNPKAKIDIREVLSSGVLRQTMMMNPALEDLMGPLKFNGFPVELPPPPQPGFLLLLAVFAFLAVSIYGVYIFFPQLLKLQTFRAPFLILTIIGFLYAASGGGFLKANRPPMTSYRDGTEQWVHRDYQQMLGIEISLVMIAHFFTAFGLFCGVLALVPHGLTQSILQLTTPVDYQQHIQAVEQKDGASTKTVGISTLDRSVRFERRVSYYVFQLLPQDLVFAMGFGIFFFGYYFLLNMFTIKMPSYPFGF